jgi:hypothetical protein
LPSSYFSSASPQLRGSILASGRATSASPLSGAAMACTSHKIHCLWASWRRGVSGSGYERHLLHCLPRPQSRPAAPFLGSPCIAFANTPSSTQTSL